MNGQRNLDRADQEAERHADADRDVAEFRGALDRVAEVLAHRREIVAMGEHADAVAELEHEIRARQDVGVAAADLDQDGRLLPRQVEIAERPADHGRARGEHAQIVEVPTVLDEAAGRSLAEQRARLRKRFLGGSRGEQDVVFGDDGVGRGRLVAALATQRDDLHAGRQRGHHFADRLAEEVRVAQRDLEHFETAGRRRLDLRLQDHERDVEEQDRPGHAERIGHRIAHRRVVVAERRDRRLQRRRAGPRTGEQPQREAEIDAHRLHEQQAHRTRRQHADQRQQVRLLPAGARQPDEELLAVLMPTP